MEISLISLEEIKTLKKKKAWLLFFILGTLLALLAFAAAAYGFQNRSTGTLWIAGGTVLTSLWLIASGFVFLKMLSPLDHYLRFSVKALSQNRPINQVRIDSVSNSIETYNGFKTIMVVGKEIDEFTILHYRLEASADCQLKKGRIYEIEAYDDVIVRVKERT